MGGSVNESSHENGKWFWCKKFCLTLANGILILILFFLTVTPALAQEFNHRHLQYDRLSGNYVQSGMVDYSGLKTDSRALDQYLDGLAQVAETRFNSWSESQQLAFLINLYNAATLGLILENYPVKSIKDIGGFFKGPWGQPVVSLFGGTITLNTLEHEIVRKKYDEPRIHLALVCAAKGCPPLRSEAYTDQKLNMQLDDQAKQFFGNPLKFRIDRRKNVVYLSPIFKWYGEDFIGKYTPEVGFGGLDADDRAVVNFSSRYLGKEDRKYLIGGGYKVKYLDYDWSINEREGVR
ncbi:MAG: DUF547 domain-containing protein [Candidatus Glassbacteria bacterium]|nr:DUF547 domain-containing protein [Candidatus Glassbacteria bacterium]